MKNLGVLVVALLAFSLAEAGRARLKPTQGGLSFNMNPVRAMETPKRQEKVCACALERNSKAKSIEVVLTEPRPISSEKCDCKFQPNCGCSEEMTQIERTSCSCGNGSRPKTLKFASAYSTLDDGINALKSPALSLLPADLQDLLLLLGASERSYAAIKLILKQYPNETLNLGNISRHFCVKCRHEMKIGNCCDVIGQCFQDLLKADTVEVIKLVILGPDTEINGSAIKTGRLGNHHPITIRGKVTFRYFSKDNDMDHVLLKLLEDNEDSKLKLGITHATLLWSVNDDQDAVAKALSLLPTDLPAIELKGGGSVCYEGVTLLQKFTKLKKLVLELNDEFGITTTKIAEICKHLDLESFESSHKTFRGLVTFLKNIRQLKSLSMTNSVTEEDLASILNSRHVATITDLYLCLNNFSSSVMILPLVATMPQLQFLDLSYCEIEKEVLILLCSAIVNFKTLRSVRLKQFHLRLKRVASYEVAEIALRIMTSSVSKFLVEITVDATNNEQFITLCRGILRESKFENVYGMILVNSLTFPVGLVRY